jgi:hypothetical protein
MTAGTALKISNTLIENAKISAGFYKRSVTKQIEYWADIGRTALDNPDLPISFIIGTLEAIEELKHTNKQELKEYQFD